MRISYRQTKAYLRRKAGRPWVAPLVGLLAAMDAILFFLPVDGFFLAALMGKKRRRKSVLQAAIVGTFFGAIGLTFFGQWLVETGVVPPFEQLLDADQQQSAIEWLKWAGPLAIGFLVWTPTPYQPVVVLALWMNLSPIALFLALALGRSAKFLTYYLSIEQGFRWVGGRLRVTESRAT